MTSNVLTCSASTLVSNNKFKYSPLPVGLGPSSLVSTTPSLKSPSSRPSGRLVVKAQQEGSPNFLNPIEAEHFNKKVALLETSPYGKNFIPSNALL